MTLRKIVIVLCFFNIANGNIIMNEEDKIPILENRVFKLTDEEYLKREDVKFQIDMSKEQLNGIVTFELNFELNSNLNTEQQDVLTNNPPSFEFFDLGTGYIKKEFDIKLDVYLDEKKVDSFFITRDVVFPKEYTSITSEDKILERTRGINNEDKIIESYILVVYADDLTKIRLKPTVYLRNMNVYNKKIFVSARNVGLFEKNSDMPFVFLSRVAGDDIFLIKYSGRYKQQTIQKIKKTFFRSPVHNKVIL